MLRGRYLMTIESSGRCEVPAKFVEALSANGEPRIIMAAGLEGQVLAYGQPEWREREQRLAEIAERIEEGEELRRMMTASALECELEPDGSVELPDELRKHADLAQEVIWVGMNEYIELWNPRILARWRAKTAGAPVMHRSALAKTPGPRADASGEETA